MQESFWSFHIRITDYSKLLSKTFQVIIFSHTACWKCPKVQELIGYVNWLSYAEWILTSRFMCCCHFGSLPRFMDPQWFHTMFFFSSSFSCFESLHVKFCWMSKSHPTWRKGKMASQKAKCPKGKITFLTFVCPSCSARLQAQCIFFFILSISVHNLEL